MTWADRLEWGFRVAYLVTIAAGAVYLYHVETHPRPYIEGWNACVAEVQRQTGPGPSALWFLNVTLPNMSPVGSDTLDTAEVAGPPPETPPHTPDTAAKTR